MFELIAIKVSYKQEQIRTPLALGDMINQRNELKVKKEWSLTIYFKRMTKFKEQKYVFITHTTGHCWVKYNSFSHVEMNELPQRNGLNRRVLLSWKKMFICRRCDLLNQVCLLLT